MRLVHLADLHLGYRAYQRTTKGGINQREADVARTFTRVIDHAITLAPECVVVAGDVFHHVRPSNPAIVHAFREFSRLRAALPETLVVLIAGNHDEPRVSDTGCILPLFASLGVRVVADHAQRIDVPAQDCSILAVPDIRGARPAFEPDPARSRNVLLLHGEVEGMTARRTEGEITREQLGAERFEYVALGHYHVMREVAPNACYAGSIDYTSSDIFGEWREERRAGLSGKGFLEVDVETGARTFHAIAPSRVLLDLDPIDAMGLGPSELDLAIGERLASIDGGIDEKIVRLVVRDVAPGISADLDYEPIRQAKARALDFKLDLRKAEAVRVAASAPSRKSLAERFAEIVVRNAAESGIDPDEVLALGNSYLAAANERDTSRAIESDEMADTRAVA